MRRRRMVTIVVAGGVAMTLASMALAGAALARGPAAKKSAVDRLTRSQLVGQRVILSYDGPLPPAALFDQIRRGRAAGVIFFGANITSRQQIGDVVARLQEAAEHAVLPRPLRRPLLMMTDQEGGSSVACPARRSSPRRRSASPRIDASRRPPRVAAPGGTSPAWG